MIYSESQMEQSKAQIPVYLFSWFSFMAGILKSVYNPVPTLGRNVSSWGTLTTQVSLTLNVSCVMLEIFSTYFEFIYALVSCLWKTPLPGLPGRIHTPSSLKNLLKKIDFLNHNLSYCSVCKCIITILEYISLFYNEFF